MSEDGKIIIDSEEEEENEINNSIQGTGSTQHANDPDENDAYLESIENPDGLQKSGRKYFFSQSKPMSIGYTSKRGQAMTKTANIETGEKYRTTKAQGDIKRAGLPDPYAYIPLGAKLSRKRTIPRQKSNPLKAQLHRIVHRKIKKHKK
ncbi:hypothetical protein HMI54_014089 [Coelomomyces lativittatus]|nr:hypothetical protein HMI54_014089 [Coelomomyces lativittatus]